MKHYVIARKAGTELITGSEDLVFQVPDQDLAVAFAEWLMRGGWTVRLTDSGETSPEPRNTAMGAEVVSFVSQQFIAEAARLQIWGHRRGTPGQAAGGPYRRPAARP